jgi:hypothetical protein
MQPVAVAVADEHAASPVGVARDRRGPEWKATNRPSALMVASVLSAEPYCHSTWSSGALEAAPL